MIFSEEEVRKYGREKRILFPVKPPKKQDKPDRSQVLLPAIGSVFQVVIDIAASIKKGFNALDSKIDDIAKSQTATVKPEIKPAKSDKWEFKIIRDVSNHINAVVIE
jgi:hypothetical protein